MESEVLDYYFKFLVMGNAGVGKSCLLHQFTQKKFKQVTNHTIGVEFDSKVVNLSKKSVKLQVWDTAGLERFRSITRGYYRWAAGALLVYDISSRESYNSLTNWLTDARTLAAPNIVIVLVGNKKDLDADREVTFMEASRFAQENGLSFLETSALTGENAEEMFLSCARTILTKINTGELDPDQVGSGTRYGSAAATTTDNQAAKPSTKSLAEQVSDELTCAICFCRYDNPKVLPCLHVYCENCLHTMVDKARDKTKLSCPQCQEVHLMPVEGVHGFKTYFMINNLVELLQIHEVSGLKENKKPLQCETGMDDNPAVAFARRALTICVMTA